jgi:hypothetical protein
MINLIDLILIVDDVISNNESELLISEFETTKDSKYTITEYARDVGNDTQKRINAEFVVLAPKTQTQQIVNDKTNIMVEHYKNYIEEMGYFDTHGLISRLGFAHKYRVVKYDIGSSFHDHSDKNPFVYGSCSLALNDDYEGGEYRFFRGGHKVKLKKGQGMIWPADYFFTHGVEEVTAGCKYSTNSFLGDIRCVVNDADPNAPTMTQLFGVLRNEIVIQNQIAVDNFHKSSNESITTVMKLDT